MWQNCHFCQIRHIRKLLGAPFTILYFGMFAIVAKIVNFALFAKFARFANIYGPPSLLCALPCWWLWQNSQFCHICQIGHICQLLWAPFTALCLASLPIVGKLSFSSYLPTSPTFMGPLPCFVLCLIGDCGKVVILLLILLLFAKFADIFSFLPFLLLRAFLDISLFVSSCSHSFNKTFRPSEKKKLPRWILGKLHQFKKRAENMRMNYYWTSDSLRAANHDLLSSKYIFKRAIGLAVSWDNPH